jgi:hypothetical protein
MSVYVVDTGERELYVLADEDYEAAELVAAVGESVNYAEFYSDDPDDIPIGAIMLPECKESSRGMTGWVTSGPSLPKGVER